ncbi:MAG: hypothetical protein JST16_06440 [Bdellovibrionales bacterium]|nr:hypothetical protein [Bdellovibrionales bacterium]
MKSPEVHRLECVLLEAIDHYRSYILDPVEQELGASPSWKYLRGRLLKALGDRGLAGRVREILAVEFNSGGGK